MEKCSELNDKQKEQLHGLLKRFEDLFDGSLGEWKMEGIDLELKPGVKPYHAKTYPVPHSQEQKLKEEVERLVKYGILRKINSSEWAAPMFTISKPDVTLRSLADFRE